ncbi:MAG: long-chain fatty acid--CoA ligase [Candidatus Omnitrophica bacterium]|nr:long-chain fatty acid--CoA ligase [Candidatus Omnitrophota bacterium]
MATIIYTSGTTGPPKGVMLTHANFLQNCVDSMDAISLGERDTTLSFLPLSHVFERMAGFYFPIMCGATIAYAENMNTVPQNLREVKPTIACAVPRVYEKVYARVADTIEHSPPFLQKLIRWAIEIGHRSIPFRLAGRCLPPFLWLCYQFAKVLVFQKLKRQLGGRLRFFISGGAPLPKKLGEFFFAAGIYILEGYGLTETSPVISVNRLNQLKFGTVGVPLAQVETRIASDGEIIVRGPSVMLGYYQNPQATAEVIREGWFHTGDIGQFDSEGFLMITDRKKDIIVTSGGKNLSPQNIENLLLRSRAIQQAVVIGDQHNYLVALIVPNFTYFFEQSDLKGRTNEEVSQLPLVNEFVRQEIDRETAELASYEKIKYFCLLPRELTQENGELTPTLKVKRKVVGERYGRLIEAMYLEGEKKKSP